MPLQGKLSITGGTGILILKPAWVFFRFGRYFRNVSECGLSAYIILSIAAVVACSIRFRANPNNFNRLHRSLMRRINFVISSILIPFLVIQIGFFYYNRIPPKDDLIGIQDTIDSISYYADGFPEFFEMKKQGDARRYYISTDINLMKKWRIAEKPAVNRKEKTTPINQES